MRAVWRKNSASALRPTGMPFTSSAMLLGTPGPPSIMAVGTGEVAKVIDLVRHVAERLFSGRQAGKCALLIPEPAPLIPVLIGEFADVNGLVRQFRARNHGLARKRRFQVAQQGGKDRPLLHAVFGNRFAVLQLQVAQQNAARPTRIRHDRAHVDERLHLLVKVRGRVWRSGRCCPAR